MFSLIVEGLEVKYHDFLGDVFGYLELYNKYRGQFFTPYHLGVMKAQMILSKTDIEKHRSEKGYFTISDPCSGAGCLLIAAADVIRQMGFNHSEVVLFRAQDIDQLAFYMSYIQLSLTGMAGYCILGDSLIPDQESQIYWFTPVYFISRVWQSRRIIRAMQELTKPLKKSQEDQKTLQPDINLIKDQYVIGF